MDFVSLALYAEGSPDDDFLPLVIARTAQTIFQQHQQYTQILPVKPVHIRKQRDRAMCILEAACVAAEEHHILVVHSDSDTRGAGQTLQQLFLPGAALVQQQQSGVCACLVPIIPVQAVEAWMLADVQLLESYVGLLVLVNS